MKATRAALVVALAALTLASCRDRETTAQPAAREHVQTGDSPEGYAPVELDAERVQLFGVRIEPARREPLTRDVRTVGVVRTDETRESHVHVKWEGWIQEFFVSYVGQEVKRGDPLFSVYSPDLVTSQQELIVAHTRATAASGSGRAGERASAEALLETARTKLRFYDIADDAIARIEKDGRVLRTLSVRAPRSGTVIEKMVLPGMYVEPPMDLYTIADLSRVWVLADLYEYEVPYVQVGQTARFSPVGAEGSPLEFAASVAFIDPTVDPDTRTVKVRLELPNEERRLRPGAYGTVKLEIPLEPELTVPADAVLDTGARQLVFVRVGEGRFEARAVRLGARARGRVQVLEGLREGDLVVTRAQFLLDSESRLRGAAAGGEREHGAHP
ncbi:MAG: efflux RND transporter periplasmic adaptor subunit [Myxococcota bacterium]